MAVTQDVKIGLLFPCFTICLAIRLDLAASYRWSTAIFLRNNLPKSVERAAGNERSPRSIFCWGIIPVVRIPIPIAIAIPIPIPILRCDVDMIFRIASYFIYHLHPSGHIHGTH